MQTQKLAAQIENFIDLTGRAVSWLSIAMVAITFIVVILRYVFDIGWIALQESITYLHATLFLVAAAYTLQNEAHVRVDIFYTHFSESKKAWVDLFGTLFLLLPMMVFISVVSWQYILESWHVLEGSREAGGLPGVFLLKSMILLMTSLLILLSIAKVIRCIHVLKQN